MIYIDYVFHFSAGKIHIDEQNENWKVINNFVKTLLLFKRDNSCNFSITFLQSYPTWKTKSSQMSALTANRLLLFSLLIDISDIDYSLADSKLAIKWKLSILDLKYLFGTTAPLFWVLPKFPEFVKRL